ncbi:damage-inducible protein DinB [Paenibacillus nanensis]|uniref:Damage-inducible protein DinB n=1 Tax=Paenibacillus nanensis TaxID=393251 RepID=A0A3A1UNJ9_9BACL|nr:DinB family protein [Paenibacillus nanensis]RIX50128.1 damage-inducible protein DinB [Paenibacillus nanensis]
MYRKVEDFLADWEASSAGTLSVFRAITDDKMNVAIAEGHNSLGWLAWHLIGVGGMFGRLAGLQVPTVGRDEAAPPNMADIIAKYEELVEAFKTEAAKLADDMLSEEVDGFVGKTYRGKLLRGLIDHQTHHRGQMTVLLRQAGLTVPGIMGPTREMQAAKG